MSSETHQRPVFRRIPIHLKQYQQQQHNKIVNSLLMDHNFMRFAFNSSRIYKYIYRIYWTQCELKYTYGAKLFSSFCCCYCCCWRSFLLNLLFDMTILFVLFVSIFSVVCCVFFYCCSSFVYRVRYENHFDWDTVVIKTTNFGCLFLLWIFRFYSYSIRVVWTEEKKKQYKHVYNHR